MNKEDFESLWLKQSLSVGACSMHLVKWSPNFNVAKDSPVLPIWMSLKHVPILLFHPEALFELVKPLGKPDSATAGFTRLDKARVLVELDVSTPLPQVIWIEIKGQKLKIPVKAENLPAYSTHCSKLGHLSDCCFAKYPNLRPKGNANANFGSSNPRLVGDETFALNYFVGHTCICTWVKILSTKKPRKILGLPCFLFSKENLMPSQGL